MSDYYGQQVRELEIEKRHFEQLLDREKDINVTLGVGLLTVTLLLVAWVAASCVKRNNEVPTVADKSYVNTQSVVIEYDYSRLTHATCKTDTECEFADAMEFYNDMRNDSYRWQAYQDTHYWLTQTSIPVLEPVECDKGDKKCEASNKANAGKPAHYPTICEPFINW